MVSSLPHIFSRLSKRRSKRPFTKKTLLHDGGECRVWRVNVRRNQQILKSVIYESTNVFCFCDNKRRRVIRGQPEMTHISQISGCREDVLGTASLFEYSVLILDAEIDGATKMVYGDTFYTEVGVSYILREHCVPLGAQFSTMYDAWKTRSHGHILMNDVGEPLSAILAFISLPSLQSIVLQVLISLHIAQTQVHFKHHDLHLGNVFLKKIKAPSSMNALYSSIDLPDGEYTAFISDFGLSAATDPIEKARVSRVDYGLLTEGSAWGKWTHQYEGNYKGYDAVYFISCLNDDFVGLPCTPAKRWAKMLMQEIRRIQPSLRLSKERGRPLSPVSVQTPILIEYITQKINDVDQIVSADADIR